MTNFVQKAKRNQKGFTLIELMIVVVIIGILVTIAVPVYNGTQKNAKVRANEANVRIIKGAAQVYLSEENTVESLNMDTLVSKGYLEDGLMHPYDKDGKSYEVSATDDDGKVTITVDDNAAKPTTP